jgi:hypothetical protein
MIDLFKYDVTRSVYTLQMIVKSKDTGNLIQNLQKLAIQGVFVAEKVSIF